MTTGIGRLRIASACATSAGSASGIAMSRNTVVAPACASPWSTAAWRLRSARTLLSPIPMTTTSSAGMVPARTRESAGHARVSTGLPSPRAAAATTVARATRRSGRVRGTGTGSSGTHVSVTLRGGADSGESVGSGITRRVRLPARTSRSVWQSGIRWSTSSTRQRPTASASAQGTEATDSMGTY